MKKKTLFTYLHLSGVNPRLTEKLLENHITAIAYETVEEVTVSPPALGSVIEFEFGLTCAVKSSSTVESVLFKWQARNSGGSWVDLHSEVTYTANASAYREYTYSGRFQSAANFNGVPFDIRLQIKSGAAGGENAVGKTKNSSYVRVIYSAS